MKCYKFSSIGNAICAIFAILFYWTVSYLYAGNSFVGDLTIFPIDEGNYEQKSGSILAASDGLLDIFSLSNVVYARSFQFGHSMLLAFFRQLFSDSFFLWLMVNNVVYILGCYYFSKFIAKYTNTKNSVLIFFSLCCYIPLAIQSFSLMRDSFIFSISAIALYLYVNKEIKWLVVCLIALTLFRLHMVLSILIFIAIDLLHKRSKRSRYGMIILLFIFSVIALALNLISGGFLLRQSAELISGGSITTIIFDFIRFWISPLPWDVSEELPTVVFYWFWITFPFVLLLFIYFCFEFLRGKLFLLIPAPIFMMFIFYLTVYSLEGTLGFRQVSGIAPFIFIPLIIRFLRDGLKLSKGLK